MKVRLFVAFFFLFYFQVFCQQPEQVQIDADNIPLNKVFIYLKENYNFQFAFDKDLLSQFEITIHNNFHSKDETIAALLKDLPLTFKKSGDVFLIIPQNESPGIQVQKNTRISGQVVEAQSFEPLPFSYILINNRSIQSDQQGNFTYLASADSIFDVRISHLGYFLFDTLISGDLVQKFTLTPRSEEIQEIQIEGNPVERSTLVGDQSGKIKINHRIAPVLPGYGDNSVFNMLRLMPGILAAGEQSSDLLIWGAYESHSKVQFDGFTIFGLKNFNDDIGVVNPLVLKDMEVFKAAYEAKYGDRVGGIVNITGKKGSLQQPRFTFNINNTTVNSLVELSVSQKSSFLVAYRQTFYELYDPSEIQLFNRRGNSSFDATVYPDYDFRDANLKYNFQDERLGAEFSLYGGGDKYFYNLEREFANSVVSRNEEEKNQQWGGSFTLSAKNNKGNTGKISAAFSMLSNQTSELNKTRNLRNGHEFLTREGKGENNVTQVTIKAENRLNFKEGHYIESGIGFESNNVQILRDLNNKKLIDQDTRLNRMFLYIQDYWPVNKNIEIKTGLRTNYAFYLNKFFPEIRVAASVKITPEIKLNASWGMVHQFLSKTTLIDSNLNYYYFWANSDNEIIPVLSGEHWVSGITFNKKGLTACVEGFYKSTNGLSRYISANSLLENGFYTGEARSFGVDFFLKKEYKKHTAWISYTLSKTEEHLPFYIRDYYRPAQQDQRHEVKIAGVTNFKSFYFSANYVYGSGFERFIFTDNDGDAYIPAYSRLDIAAVYNFKPGKVHSQIGISVLNVLNKENIKFSNIRRVATNTEDPLEVNTEAVPFTPTLFLKVSF